MDKSFLKLLATSVKENWNLPAFSNYMGETYTYGQFAERMVRIRMMLDVAEVKPGDKVALIGRNSAGWAMDFFGILAAGRVAVPILHDFKPSSVHHIIKHSGSKALIVANSVWENLDVAQLENLNIILRVDDLTVLYAKRQKLMVADLCNVVFARRYPAALRFEDVKIHRDQPEELAMLSYTSGTSGFSKGVMIPYRALWDNVRFGIDHLSVLKPGTHVISILPMAHMYGLAFEVCTEVCCGVHIHFLTRTPSPRVIADTFVKYSPSLIVAVPLVLEKIVKKNVFPVLQTTRFKVLSHIPIVKQRLYRLICGKLVKSLGGRFYEAIVGGAAFSSDVEHFLHEIHFPYTVGYGMTECAPLITYADYKTFREGSVGRAIPRMEVRIDSDDPQHTVGEIQVRGVNVMLGYYNNPSATKEAFTRDGWLRTGDLGTLDADGNLFIRGRSKNMLLGPSGQNIYPEEIEDALNQKDYVGESIIVSRDEKLVALIHPDLERMDRDGLVMNDIPEIMAHNLEELNGEIPAYSRVASFQLYPDEFEKTPKRSIKRYLYQ